MIKYYLTFTESSAFLNTKEFEAETKDNKAVVEAQLKEYKELLNNGAVELPAFIYNTLSAVMSSNSSSVELDKASFDKLIVMTNKIAMYHNAEADFNRAMAMADLRKAGKKEAAIRKACPPTVKETGLNLKYPAPKKEEEVSAPEMM